MSRTRIESLKVIVQLGEDESVKLERIYQLFKFVLDPEGIEVMNVYLERERGPKKAPTDEEEYFGGPMEEVLP